MYQKVKDTYNVYLKEKNMLIILSRMNIIQFVIIILLLITLFSLLPLKEKVPYLVQFSNAQMNFARVQKMDDSITDEKWTRKGLVTAYVLNREMKNNIDDNIRQETIRLQSSYDIWKIHKKIYTDENSIYQKINQTRDINILNVVIIPNTNIGQVDYQATVRDDGKVREISNHRVVLEFTFEKKQKSKELRYDENSLNPTTFKVITYSPSRVEMIKQGEQK